MSAIEKTSAEAGAPAERTLSTKAATAWRKTRPMRPILCLLILLIVVFAITQSRFLTFTNLQNTVTSVADLWIIGMGMTLVIISGGFDLSVGATAALSGYLLADLLQNSVPGGLALLAAIIFGLVIGAVLNGFFVGRMRLNVFVVTLASMTALTGALNLWSETNSIYATAPIIGDLSGTTLLGVQIPVWIMAATFILALYVQTRTWFGRDVYAVGGSHSNDTHADRCVRLCGRMRGVGRCH
jgi:ribose transport system permease protein